MKETTPKNTQTELTPEQFVAYKSLLEAEKYSESMSPVHIGKYKSALIQFIVAFQNYCKYKFSFEKYWDVSNLSEIANSIKAGIRINYTYTYTIEAS